MNMVFLTATFIIAHIFFNVKGLKRKKMKICAIICEYNPFHNGHLYQINETKRLSGADAVLCLMSGNFVQRGEAAIMNKFLRAKHAVMGGADVVLELPTIFATSNAELFAKGAITILASIPSVTHLSFGVENAEKEELLRTASLLNNEPQNVSARIKELTTQGISFVKAKCEAWKPYLPEKLLASPNNILGLEYTRAILSKNANIEILPIKRIGSGYSDNELAVNFSSATAIRNAIQKGIPLNNSLPSYVKNDLPNTIEATLEALEKYTLLEKSATSIANTLDCTEGLENALKKVAQENKPLVDTLTNARYTSARIRRIALQNLLNIEESLIRESLQSTLYLRILSAKKAQNELLNTLFESKLPLIVRATDGNMLNGTAKDVYNIDARAEKIYGLLYNNVIEKSIFI